MRRNFCCAKPPSLWSCVTTATWNKHGSQWFSDQQSDCHFSHSLGCQGSVMRRKEDFGHVHIFKAQNTSLSSSGYTQTALCYIFPLASLFLLKIPESFQGQLDKFYIWKSAIGFFFLIFIDLSLFVGSECLSFFLLCDLCFLTKHSFVLSISRFLLFQFLIESDRR